MAPTLNLNNDVDDFDARPIGVISPSIPDSKPDLTRMLNENILDEVFSWKVARLFNEMAEDHKIDPSIGEDGEDSDEKRRKMALLRDLKVKTKDDIDNLKEMESKLQISATEAAVMQKLLGAVFDSLDGDPDMPPESVFESMIRRILSRDVLQELIKYLSDECGKLLANPPALVSDKDLQCYAKQQTCLSKILEMFDKVDYRSDHPGYLLKAMELMTEMASYEPPPDSTAFDNFKDPK